LAAEWPLNGVGPLPDSRRMPTPVPIAAEMYTVRAAADRDPVDALERIAAIGYLGVELVGLHGLKPAELLDHARRLGLEVIGDGLPEWLDENGERGFDELRELGCEYAIGCLDEKHFASPEAVGDAAAACNRVAAGLREDGIRLLYHNHWWECTPRPDGRAPIFDFVALLDSDVGLVVDVYWVAAGGLDVAATLTELAPRVRRLHLKDGHLNDGSAGFAEPHTAAGAGVVDLAAAVAAAPQVDWHVTELDECEGDPFEALAESYVYLTGGGLSGGRES